MQAHGNSVSSAHCSVMHGAQHALPSPAMGGLWVPRVRRPKPQVRSQDPTRLLRLRQSQTTQQQAEVRTTETCAAVLYYHYSPAFALLNDCFGPSEKAAPEFPKKKIAPGKIGAKFKLFRLGFVVYLPAYVGTNTPKYSLRILLHHLTTACKKDKLSKCLTLHFNVYMVFLICPYNLSWLEASDAAACSFGWWLVAGADLF
jgi:hypothetical protein